MSYDDDDLIGFVVPWSGERTFPGGPWELPLEPGPILAPAAAPILKIAVAGAQYVWNDVWNWTSSAFHAAAKAEEQAFTVTA